MLLPGAIHRLKVLTEEILVFLRPWTAL